MFWFGGSSISQNSWHLIVWDIPSEGRKETAHVLVMTAEAMGYSGRNNHGSVPMMLKSGNLAVWEQNYVVLHFGCLMVLVALLLLCFNV